jgi:hypothetical protein
VTVEGERMNVRARRASGEEAELLWRGFIERLPAIANSRRLARRDVPMMVLEPVADGTGRDLRPAPKC